MQKISDLFNAHRKFILGLIAAVVPQIQGTGDLADGVIVVLGLLGLIAVPNDPAATSRIYGRGKR